MEISIEILKQKKQIQIIIINLFAEKTKNKLILIEKTNHSLIFDPSNIGLFLFRLKMMRQKIIFI
jgi:hypothetical protein